MYCTTLTYYIHPTTITLQRISSKDDSFGFFWFHDVSWVFLWLQLLVKMLLGPMLLVKRCAEMYTDCAFENTHPEDGGAPAC